MKATISALIGFVGTCQAIGISGCADTSTSTLIAAPTDVSFEKTLLAPGGASINAVVPAGVDTLIGGWVLGGLDEAEGGRLGSCSSSCAFLVRLGPHGETKWARRLEAESSWVWAIAVLADGTIVAGGAYQGGGLAIDGLSIEGFQTDSFLVAFAEDGHALWLRGDLGSDGFFGAFGIDSLAATPDGGFVWVGEGIPGASVGGVIVPEGLPGAICLVGSAEPTGVDRWLRFLVGAGLQTDWSQVACRSVAVDSDSGIYVAGDFSGELRVYAPEEAELPPEFIDDRTIFSYGEQQDVFIARLSPAGDSTWLVPVTRTDEPDYGAAVSWDREVGVTVTGQFRVDVDVIDATFPASIGVYYGWLVAALDGDGVSRWMHAVPPARGKRSMPGLAVAITADHVVHAFGNLAGTAQLLIGGAERTLQSGDAYAPLDAWESNVFGDTFELTIAPDGALLDAELIARPGLERITAVASPGPCGLTTVRVSDDSDATQSPQGSVVVIERVSGCGEL